MDVISKYFPGLDPGQVSQLTRFREELIAWNTKLNLVSRRDVPYLEIRHILHSLSIALFVPFPDSARVLDVGTGGGFPGIPLAIIYPEVRFTLIDSIGKKINAVREISASLGLRNVEVRQVRAEQFGERFHYIVSRAVTRLDRLTEWIKGQIHDPSPEFPGNGILYLKGGDLKDEIRLFREARIFSLSAKLTEPYFLTKKLIYMPHKAL